MRKPHLAICAFALSLLLSSCLKDKLTRTYTIYTPVYKNKTEVYANIKSNAPTGIQYIGKLFLSNNYLFLNEIDKGVHVIDNNDPANPVEKAFINIPGNLDIAVKGNTLYADLFSDLVVVDISDPLNAKFVKYVPNVFPERNYTNGFIADSSRVIVAWTAKDTTIDLQQTGNPILYTEGILSGLPSLSNVQTGSSMSAVPGISGSTARMVVVNDYLYTLNSYALSAFNINNAHDPEQTATSTMGWNIETLYPIRDKLFIGTFNGVYIYDISTPAIPKQISQFAHARSCDPVIVDGNIAYVTLHDGTSCQGFENELDVLDVTDLESATIIHKYPFTSPRGIAKDGNLLFICDGKSGVRMLDATDPSQVRQKDQVQGLETSDAIAWNKNLIVVARDGLYQFDYSDPAHLVQRSKLSVHH